MEIEKITVLYDNSYIRLIGKEVIKYTNKQNLAQTLEEMSDEEKRKNNLYGEIYIISRIFSLSINEMIIEDDIKEIVCQKANSLTSSFQYFRSDNIGLNFIDIDGLEAKVVKRYSDSNNIKYNAFNLTNKEFEYIDKRVRSMVENYLLVCKCHLDTNEYLEKYDIMYKKFINHYLEKTMADHCNTINSIDKFQDCLSNNQNSNEEDKMKQKSIMNKKMIEKIGAKKQLILVI